MVLDKVTFQSVEFSLSMMYAYNKAGVFLGEFTGNRWIPLTKGQ